MILRPCLQAVCSSKQPKTRCCNPGECGTACNRASLPHIPKRPYHTFLTPLPLPLSYATTLVQATVAKLQLAHAAVIDGSSTPAAIRGPDRGEINRLDLLSTQAHPHVHVHTYTHTHVHTHVRTRNTHALAFFIPYNNEFIP